MTDRDVVKEGLERVGFPNELLAPMAAAVLQHILDAGPDKKMASADGFNVKKPEPNHIPRWFPSQKALLSHLIERLQEQSE